jgi:hypothetical protein
MIGLGFTVIWVLALIEIVRSEFKDKNERLIWLLLVILLPLIGTILYFAIGRKQRIETGSDIL